MSFEFTPRRVLLLVTCLLAYAAMGGLSTAALNHRAWVRLTIFFVVGAICATVIDHQVGIVDRSNLRFAYVLIGVILMAAAGLWLHAIRVH